MGALAGSSRMLAVDFEADDVWVQLVKEVSEAQEAVRQRKELDLAQACVQVLAGKVGVKHKLEVRQGDCCAFTTDEGVSAVVLDSAVMRGIATLSLFVHQSQAEAIGCLCHELGHARLYEQEPVLEKSKKMQAYWQYDRAKRVHDLWFDGADAKDDRESKKSLRRLWQLWHEVHAFEYREELFADSQIIASLPVLLAMRNYFERMHYYAFKNDYYGATSRQKIESKHPLVMVESHKKTVFNYAVPMRKELADDLDALHKSNFFGHPSFYRRAHALHLRATALAAIKSLPKI